LDHAFAFPRGYSNIDEKFAARERPNTGCFQGLRHRVQRPSAFHVIVLETEMFEERDVDRVRYICRAVAKDGVRKGARDETGHSALAFRVAAWMDARLSTRERTRVEEAKKRAVAELRRELACEPPHAVVTAAGVPTSKDARALLDRAERALWVN
jgi:hypothetical protein